MSKINNLTENGDSEVFFDGGDKVEVSTLGKLEVKDGVIYIDYEECTEGLEGTRTLFFFDTEHPERVNLCRRGSVCFDLVFACGGSRFASLKCNASDDGFFNLLIGGFSCG